MRIVTELRRRWRMSLRVRAGIIASVLAIVMMSGEVLAKSCWDDYSIAVNQAWNEYSQCLNDVMWRTDEFGVPQVLLEELTFQRQLCAIKWFSDAWQAEAAYISCMAIEPLVTWFKTE